MKKVISIFLFFTTLTSLLYGQTPLLSHSSPEESGFKRDSIKQLVEEINQIARKDLRAVVVIKDDQIVLEKYYNTFWRKTIHDIRSAGKSITSLLLGIAIKDGLISDLDQSVYSLFTSKKNPNINIAYKKIKVRHLLDMSSGLDADSDDSNTPGQAGQWIGKDNWKDYLLNIPVVNTPGEKYVYADINPLLIGLAIEEASGMSLKDYAQRKLFDPLGFEPGYWYTNAANQTGAAGNLYITAIDFVKLGMLVLNKGNWNGQQIIQSEYIEQLESSKNFSRSEIGGADHYGMLWYKAVGTFGNKKLDILFAAGNGGNYLMVVPTQKLVVVVTSGAYGPGYGHRRSRNIISKILTAIE